MKKITFIAFLAITTNVFSQPIIQNGKNIPAFGYSAPVSYIVSSSKDITDGGASHTWDFSSYTFNAGGTLGVINPTSAPMGSSFTTANYAFSNNGTYSFFKMDSNMAEVQAWTITSAGSGNDYTPNPRTILKFPFNFNDSVTDTWQKVGGSTNNVTLYYDSYGKLITPTGTYNNVVRVRENYGVGADDYMWYMLNPLIPVAIYNHNNNTLFLIAAKQANGITNENAVMESVQVFPNPAGETIHLNNIPASSSLSIVDLNGKTIYHSTVTGDQTTINTSDLANGIYMLKVENQGHIFNKKLIVSK